jgi:putative phage-type endonuclease
MWHDVTQANEEWFNLRLGKLTASKFSEVMANYPKNFGEPAKKYALSLALETLTSKRQDSYSNGYMLRGIELEPVARELYQEHTFLEVTNGGFFDCGGFGASPDGLVGDNGIIEIKSVIASTHYATLTRSKFDPAYKWQIALQLYCSDREWCDFISYCPEFPEHKQLLIYRVTRDYFDKDFKYMAIRINDFLNLVSEIISDIKNYE